MVEKSIVTKELYFDENDNCYIEESKVTIDGKTYTVVNKFPKDGPTVKELIYKLINAGI